MASHNPIQESNIPPFEEGDNPLPKDNQDLEESGKVSSLKDVSDMQPNQIPPPISIEKEESEVKDSTNTVTKLRTQNDLLRRQIKDLSLKLTNALETINKKGKSKSDQTPSASEIVLRKQLQTAYKQIDNFKKQIQAYVDKGDIQDYIEKVKKLEDLVVEKDFVIDELQADKKVLEKVNREQGRELENYRDTQGFEERMNKQADEINALRDKVTNMHTINRHNEKNYKKQQEHMVSITRQYSLVCEKLGISSSLTFNRAEELDQILRRKAKSHRNSEDMNDELEEVLLTTDYGNTLQKVMLKTDRGSSFMTPQKTRTLSQANLKSLREQAIDPTRNTPENKFKKEISSLNTKIYLLESEKKQMKSKILENEKKITIVKKTPSATPKSILRPKSLPRLTLLKTSDSQRISTTNGSTAIESALLPSKIENDNEIYEPRVIGSKTSRNNRSKSPKERFSLKKPLITMRKAICGRIESGLSEFNDKDYITNPITSKINKLMIFSDENSIYGIQAFYTVQNSFYVAGEENLGSGMRRKSKFISSVEIAGDDHILWISGKYSEGISFLKIKTAKGNIREFGNDKIDSSEFKITVEPEERLALLHGALYYKKGNDDQEDLIVLANIGFTLVKETTQ